MKGEVLYLLTFPLFFPRLNGECTEIKKTAILDGRILPFDASGRHMKDKFVVIFFIPLFYTIYRLSSREKIINFLLPF